MLTRHEQKFSILFIILVLIEQITTYVSSLNNFHFIAKPLLLIALTSYFSKHNKHLKPDVKRFTLLALLFSLLGDILLMFVDTSAHFFISGLISFLLAHIMYTTVFLKKRQTSKKAIHFIILLLIYACGLFYLLKDGLGNLLIPVIIYMAVILSMATTSFLRQKNNQILSYNFVLLGAILFMISDSLLALNKFYQPLAIADFSIMITYAFAQIFIVFGITKQR